MELEEIRMWCLLETFSFATADHERKMKKCRALSYPLSLIQSWKHALRIMQILIMTVIIVMTPQKKKKKERNE